MAEKLAAKPKEFTIYEFTLIVRAPTATTAEQAESADAILHDHMLDEVKQVVGGFIERCPKLSALGLRVEVRS